MQFFKHFTNMRHDLKLERVIEQYGLKGYGLYNYIIESIAESLSSDQPLPELEATAKDLSRKGKEDEAVIEEMIGFMIREELFAVNEINGRVLCHKIYKFLDKSQTRSPEIRKMIQSYKDSKCLGQVQTVSDIPDRSRYRSRVDKDKEKKKDTAFFNAVNKYFYANSTVYHPDKKEGSHIHHLETKLKTYEEFLPLAIAFKELTESTDEWWRQQPFIPSAMNSLLSRIKQKQQSKQKPKTMKEMYG
jgi:hypothetical protein